MKKVISILLTVVILTILLTACGNVAHVTRTKVDSDYFTQEEIDDAIDVIVDYFRREFDGCTLNEIHYIGDERLYRMKQDPDDVDMIVLESTFTTGGYSDGSLTPNTTYDGYTWTLRRTDGGKWTHNIYEHGFG